MTDKIDRINFLNATNNIKKRINKLYGHGKITKKEKCIALRTLNSLKGVLLE